MTMPRTIRQTLTIARRDFIATVFTPIFLVFLFAPLLMASFGAIGGLGAASVAAPDGKARVVAIVPDALARPIAAADTALRVAIRRDEMLVTVAPAGDAERQARALFATPHVDTAAVLYGPLTHPTILVAPRGNRAADYLVVLARATLAARASGGTLPAVTETRTPFARATASIGGQHQSASFAVFGIFFLTLFLSGQVVGTMAEERSNKVVEVLAAAVPLESVFFGKLLGMFGVATLFVAFWGTVVSQIGALMPAGAAAGLAELTPAVGGPVFACLFFIYFATAYLLLGAVFLGVGAQASTMREIQMLSLPITVLQMAMLGFASLAVSRPGTWFATAAELFPLSSSYAMVGHAANTPELWPHVAAIAWQLLWVAVVITIGARLFRRGVLQSGSATPRWWRRRRD